MNKNPFYHAFLALAYIVVLVSSVFSAPYFFSGPEESIFYPMMALATLVLSVAVMAYLFFYQPVVLLLDRQPEQAVRFFLRTVGTFAVGTIIIVLIAFVVNRFGW